MKNKENILNQFKGVKTLFHCENQYVENYVLKSLDDMSKEDKNLWENVSYSNDCCDSFHLGNHDYVDKEIHIKFFTPNSFEESFDLEQFNKWVLIRENGGGEIIPIEGEEEILFKELKTLLEYVRKNLGDLTFKQ